MKIILLFCAFVLAATGVCPAQSNYTETITISTYYPSPYGVYQTLTFLPNDSFDPATSSCREGEMSYSKSNQALYICKGSSPSWKTFGFVAGNKKIKSDHFVSTNQCSGTKYSSGQTCDSEWYRDITFPVSVSSPAFTGTPKVFVVPERVSDPVNSSCTGGRTDFMAVFPESATISKTGFRAWASGSPNWRIHSCSDDGERSRAEIGWLAIGD
jgi:hypothetical protein